MRLMSAVGMGVLVGTSLIVIIPEGVDTLYNSHSAAVRPSRRDVHIRALPEIHSLAESTNWLPRRDSTDADAFNLPGPVLPEGMNLEPPKTPTEPGVVGILESDSQDSQQHEGTDQKNETEHGNSSHAWVGVALIAGFILMYLIDRLPQYISVSKPVQQRYHIALNELGRGFQQSTNDTEETEDFLGNQNQSQQTRSFATTVGLVIHAAADGIALGASSSTENTSLSFVIFLAIMVHKAPAAFGLTSVLLKQGVSKRAARGHLVLFSLAAPTGAILTWTLAQFIGFGKLASAATRDWWTGMLLLFSGGTFLYVAMQTMQEFGSSHAEPHMNGRSNGYLDRRDSQPIQQKPDPRDLLASVFGMILPLFLQIGHAA